MYSCEIQSTFFTSLIVDNYNDAINSNKLKLMNLDDLTAYFLESILEITSENYNEHKCNFLEYLRENYNKNNICSTDIIGAKYVNNAIKYSTDPKNYINYDIAFLVKEHKHNMCKFDDKLNDIIGFIVVQRGECCKYENAYALKLVCSISNCNGGSMLVGLYLYTILSHPKKTDLSLKKVKIIVPTNTNIILKNKPNGSIKKINDYLGVEIDQIAILELSGGYVNIKGLCLYTKFGFKIKENLSGPRSNCFYDIQNIPFIIKYDELETTILHSIEKIINIVLQTDIGYNKHVISTFTNSNTQLFLAKLYMYKNLIRIEIDKLNYSASINKYDNERLTEYMLRTNAINVKINEIELLDKHILLEMIPNRTYSNEPNNLKQQFKQTLEKCVNELKNVNYSNVNGEKIGHIEDMIFDLNNPTISGIPSQCKLSYDYYMNRSEL